MKRFQNLILLALVVILVVLPLLLVRAPKPGPDGKTVEIFTGADGQAEDMIGKIVPDYQPWAEPLLEPPSGEIESLLFVPQVALLHPLLIKRNVLPSGGPAPRSCAELARMLEE